MRRWICWIALLTAAACTGFASDGPMDRATLRGLKAIKVVVDPLGEELIAGGLRAAQLQAEIQDRLSRAGIAVDAGAVEFIGLRLMSAHQRKSPYALWISLDLYQTVALAREAKLKTTTETWGTQSILLVPAKQLSQAASETTGELADQFIEAYRSVNPNP